MHSRFHELKASGRLPSPSGVGMEILRLTQDPDFDTGELVSVIQRDPALTGRLLKMANGFQAAGASPITTVFEAAMRIGAMAVRNLALGFSLISGNRTGRCEAFDYDTYWARSLLTAAVARELASCVPPGAGAPTPAEAFVCGLLARVGALGLASTHPAAYATLLIKCEGRPDAELVFEERRTFEITHPEVSAALLRDWGLAASHADAVSSFLLRDRRGQERELAGVLWGADVLAAFQVSGPSLRRLRVRAVDEARAAFGWAEDELGSLMDRICGTWAELGSLLEVPTPAEPFGDAWRAARAAAASRPSPPSPGRGSGTGDSGPARPSGGVEGTVPSEGSGVRVLVVEDDRVTLRLLVHELDRRGYSVRTAADGRSGLREALEWGPHVVITDWSMPGMDGLSLCQALRRYEAGREMYVVVLTGNTGDGDVIAAFEAGADDYISKPFRPRLLEARVRAGMRVVALQQRVAGFHSRMQEQVSRLGILSRRLEQASLTDSLTGLPNRRYAMRHLAARWERARAAGQPLALVLADVDHFKAVNDRHGHDVGDHVLQEVGTVFTRTLRTGETMCRIGGEEFLLVCDEVDLAGGLACARRLRSRLASHRIATGEFDGVVTASMGVAEMRPGMSTPDELLKAADQAVYAAKERGRNRVETIQDVAEPV